MPDLYEVLQVHRRAQPEVIRAAYRALARKYHPDFGGELVQMVALNEAWRVLSDDTRRAAYDAELQRSFTRRATDRPAPAPIVGFSPTARGNGPLTARDSGTVIDFGRYAGWSVGRLVDHDPDYLEWLARTPVGRRMSAEIETVLAGRTTEAEATRPASATGRRGRR